MAENPDSNTGPFIFEGARLLLIDVAVSWEAAARLLPPPLSLSRPAVATFFFADYPKTAFGSVYQEAGLMLRGRDDGGDFVHCPWIVVDDSTGMILGRELFGFPKRMAEVDFEITDRAATGVVHRRGAELLRIEARLGGIDSDPAPLFTQRCVNAVGSLVTGMSLMEASSSERIHEQRSALGKVLVGSSPPDDLAALEPEGVGEGRLVTLDYGTFGSLPPLGSPRFIAEIDSDWVAANYYARAL